MRLPRPKSDRLVDTLLASLILAAFVFGVAIDMYVLYVMVQEYGLDWVILGTLVLIFVCYYAVALFYLVDKRRE